MPLFRRKDLTLKSCTHFTVATGESSPAAGLAATWGANLAALVVEGLARVLAGGFGKDPLADACFLLLEALRSQFQALQRACGDVGRFTNASYRVCSIRWTGSAGGGVAKKVLRYCQGTKLRHVKFT